ncbi:filamentous hemagglutinin N-terminal domain-containing protein [Phormidesmis sp. 146-35]
MKRYDAPLWLAGCFLLCEGLIIRGAVPTELRSALIAQVIPDRTTPTTVTGDCIGSCSITGGTVTGQNLFHSFDRFSIPTNGEAAFNNAADIQNIFTRVTGGIRSDIDGSVRANGIANVFLLNPSGILFGANARLNIGGSFLASTADSIIFDNGNEFSAVNPQTPPLLTISTPIGLQFGQNPGTIRVEGNGYNLSAPVRRQITRGTQTGLQVQPGNTLALIGGDIELEGGTLTAEQGRIELGSVGSDEQIRLNSKEGFALSYPGVDRFQDIRLSQQALADASGGGIIQVQANNISLTNSSIFLIQNREQQGGKINVQAAQSLEVSGPNPTTGFYGGVEGQTIGSGNSADIVVSARQIVIRDGAGIITRSFGSGQAGDLTIDAPDSTQVIGFSPISTALTSLIASSSTASGASGNVTLSTGQLIALNGGSVASVNFGLGQGGEVRVTATRSIEVIGESSVPVSSNISAITLADGNAGSVIVTTPKLVIRNGGIVTSDNFARGQGGNVLINAIESIEITGKGTPLPSRISASAVSLPESSRRVFGTPLVPTGASGSVTINTGQLRISNGGVAGVEHPGTGNAGTLRINAHSVILEGQGSITAATRSGEGGNLDIQVSDTLVLRRNSQITTSALGSGNGGNIDINTAFAIAVPQENSDIQANAVAGQGGNVRINAQGIFGIEARSQPTPLSDITASSELGVAGTIAIQQPDVQPEEGTINLPNTFAAPPLAQGCNPGSNQTASFVNTGRGGVPTNPNDPIVADTLWQDTEDSVQPVSSATPQRNNPQSSEPEVSIVEAQGWIMNSDGTVILVANAPTVTPHRTGIGKRDRC